MKKYLLFFFLLIIVSFRLDAQEFKTDQSIARQLKDNAQPGMKYGPAASSAVPQVKPHTTMAEEIRSGKFGQVKSGQGGAPAAKTAARAGNDVALPSNKSASEAAQEKKTLPAQTIQSPPVQQEAAGSSTEDKTGTIRPVKTIPVKKAQQ